MGAHVLDDEAFQWTITEHHSIFDGWSLASAISEIIENYQLLLAGNDPRRRPMRSLYRDFIVAERAALGSAQSESFWLDQASDRPDSRLPRWQPDRTGELTGEVRDGEQHHRDDERGWGELTTLLPEELLIRLTALARRCRVPVKSVILAAHLRVLSLVTGSPDLVIGFGTNGRLEEEDGAEVLGLFMNTVPLRVKLPEGSWMDLIRAAFDAEREMLPHRRYPFGALQRLLGGSALFEVNFGYNNFRQLASDSVLSLAGQQEDGVGGMARTNFPLVVAVSHEPGTAGLRLDLEYDARELAPLQMSLLRDYYVRALESMTADPGAAHQLAPLLGETERALTASWNDTGAEIPPLLVHQLVQARAAATPDEVAVVSGQDQLTYAELNSRANQLAWQLRQFGVGPEIMVGVCLERSAELVVALLAVLKAGGVYVPLDAAFPADRLAYMLRQVGALVVLAHDSTADELPAGLWQVINLDTDAPPPSAPAGNLPELATPDNACYVIFTSGSTGQPKGVVTVHRNVTELLHGGDCMALTPADTILQLASLSFDVSTFELWAPLAAGARLVLAPPVRYGPAEIAAWAAEHKVTVLHVTASLFALLVEHEPQLFGQLRRLLTGSETVSPRHTAQILARFPELEVVNCWGPTETTTFSVCGTYTRDTLPGGPLPLGTPLANTGVYVLDHHGQPVPRHRRRALRVRAVPGPRLPRQSGPHRRAVHPASRHPGRPPVPHGRPRPVVTRRPRRLPRPRRPHGQDPRLPHRARRGSGRARALAGRPAGRRSRGAGSLWRQRAARLRRRRCRAPPGLRYPADVPGIGAPALPGAQRHHRAGRTAGQRQRQGRHRRPARPGTSPGGPPRRCAPAADAAGAGDSGDLG